MIPTVPNVTRAGDYSTSTSLSLSLSLYSRPQVTFGTFEGAPMPEPRAFVLVRHVYGSGIRLVIASGSSETVVVVSARRALQLATELLEAAQRELAESERRDDRA
jgi:hypothetical protein